MPKPPKPKQAPQAPSSLLSSASSGGPTMPMTPNIGTSQSGLASRASTSRRSLIGGAKGV